MRRLYWLSLSLAALGATLGAEPAAAQAIPGAAESPKRIAIRRLLAIQRTDSMMLAGMDQGFAAQPVDPELPAGFLDSLRARAERDITQFVDRLVPIYDSLYSAGEIDELVAFYQTRLGQRLIATQPRLMEAIMLVGQQWGMELAGRVLVDLSRQPPKRP